MIARQGVENIGGSSPLARGLPNSNVLVGIGIGIIPARAGFTIGSALIGDNEPDHPRSRGVYRHRVWLSAVGLGSSPLARGLLLIQVGAQPVDRIIPARAGFTVSHFRIGVPSQDHPRSRGVYSSPPWSPWVSTGSSPLARGLLTVVVVAIGALRIIPARAGFTG